MNPSLPLGVLIWRSIATILLLAAPLSAREPGIRMVRNINKSPGGFSRSISWVQAAGEKVLFSAYSSKEGNELWVSNGTRRGTKLLKGIRPGFLGGLARSNGAAVSDGEVVYFSADDGVHGFEPWRSDGTPDGTRMVADLVPGSGSSFSNPLFAHQGVAYFSYWLNDAPVLASYGTASDFVPLNPPDPITGEPRFKEPRSFVASGESTYFIADDVAIWKSDGTRGGTTRIGEVGTKDADSANEMKAVGDLLFVVGRSESDGGDVIWALRPASGVVEKLTAPQGMPPWTWIDELCVHQNLLFFAPSRHDDETGEFDQSFWVSDGTKAGTRLLSPEGAYSPVSWNGHVYFIGHSDDSDTRIWRSDGTVAGTVPEDEFGEGAYHLWLGGDILYFNAVDPDPTTASLWRSDGTARGTVRLRKTYGASYDRKFVALGGDFYFTDETGLYDSQLFRASGKRASALQLTRSEKTDLSALDSPDPSTAVAHGGFVYFSAVSQGFAQDLWRSNGTFGGTRRIWKAPTNEQNYLRILGRIGDRILFAHSNPEKQSRELCSISVKDHRIRVFENWDGWEPSSPIVDAGTLGYYTIDRNGKNELWRSDGTPEGTSQVLTIAGASLNVEEGSLTVLHGIAYFIEADRGSSGALWRSDGTAAGTSILREFLTHGVHDTEVGIAGLVKVGNRLAFCVGVSDEGMNPEGGVWSSDGTPAGTVLVRPMGTFRRSYVRASLDLNGLHLFLLKAHDGSLAWWRSDGTQAGTFVIHNLDAPELGDAIAGQPTVAGGKLFYVNWVSGINQLWKTEGTSGSLARIKDFASGGPMMAHGDRLYFSAYDSINGTQSWMSDGTEGGTTLVDEEMRLGTGASPFISTGERLFFKGYAPKTGLELHVLVPPKRGK